MHSAPSLPPLLSPSSLPSLQAEMSLELHGLSYQTLGS